MDPTDIVLVPFDLQRLAIYVSATTVSSLLLSGSFSVSNLLRWIQATVAFWIMAVVCGSPPTREAYHTAIACAYLATLTVLLPTTPSFTNPLSNTSWWQSRLALPPKKSPEFYSQLLSTCQIHATLFLTVPFLVLRLYDWGSQIQRWPLPILLGSTYGFGLGSILGSLLIMTLSYSPRLQGWYDDWTRASTMPIDDNPHQD